MAHNTNGWVMDLEAVDYVESEVGVFGSAVSFLSGSGRDKIVVLSDNYKKAGMSVPNVSQGSIGSCVAAAASKCVDYLKITEIVNGDREQFVNITAIEPIYYGARVVIGKNRIRGEGAIVAHAVKYISEYGTIARGKYGNIDLSTYSVDRCRKYGQGKGFPKTIEDISKSYLVSQYTRVKSWEEYRDSVANGFPVIVGSKYGYSNETDNEGFCRQNTSWNHCMSGIGVDDNSNRKGGLIDNSWGPSWLKIRKRKLGQPDGSFWADADNIDKMMRNGDAWSLSQFQGYRKKDIDTSVSW